MAEVDLYHTVGAAAFNFHAMIANDTFNFAAAAGPFIASNGFPESVTFFADLFNYDQGTFSFQLQESDDGSVWNDVESKDWFPGAPIVLTNFSSIRMGYVGKKRRQRVQVTATGTGGQGAACCCFRMEGDFDLSVVPDQIG